MYQFQGGESVERGKGRAKELYPKNKLKSARIACGLTQVQMAERVDIAYQTYCMKEHGRKDIWISEAIAILEVIREHDENANFTIFLPN